MEMGRQKRKKRDYNRSFGSFIRAIRKVRFPDSTIEDFARKLGISGPYLTRIELGKVPPPAREIVLALADIFNVNPRVLLGLAGWPQTDVEMCWETSSGEILRTHNILLHETFDTELIGYGFGIAVTPEMLRYWAALFMSTADHLERKEIDPGVEKNLDHTSVLNYALFCVDDPFPKIRNEVYEKMSTREEPE